MKKKIEEINWYSVGFKIGLFLVLISWSAFFGFMAAGSFCGAYSKGELFISIPLSVLFFCLSIASLFVD